MDQKLLRHAALAVPFLSVILGIMSSQFGWFGPSMTHLSQARGLKRSVTR